MQRVLKQKYQLKSRHAKSIKAKSTNTKSPNPSYMKVLMQKDPIKKWKKS